MIRTKIVCTIGPASREPEMLRSLIAGGMDVARLNLSHADQAEHGENIRRIRAAAESVGKPVAIMVDLQGPKLRLGTVAGEGVPVERGESITLTTEEIVGERAKDGEVRIPVQYKHLPKDVQPGGRILIDDGLIELRVQETTTTEIRCEVVAGGALYSNKGLNVPGTALSVPAITEKDWDDLDFALEQGVDWVALSFVRYPEEVRQLKERVLAHAEGQQPVRVIAKIEKPQALDTIEEIIEAADGIMVARGDLGLEIPIETVPMVQKRLIRMANTAAKPVITATQMLDSMIRNPRPTRAEASDVANAILDGTDAIMLSGETTTGKYPLEALHTMVCIAREIENATLLGPWHPPQHAPRIPDDVTSAVAHATCETASDLHAAAIISATASGRTARAVARYRPHVPIIATTPNPIVQRQLALSWGVIPLCCGRVESTDQILRDSMAQAVHNGLVEEGKRVVLTAGVTPNMPGMTNLMMVEVARGEG